MTFVLSLLEGIQFLTDKNLQVVEANLGVSILLVKQVKLVSLFNWIYHQVDFGEMIYGLRVFQSYPSAFSSTSPKSLATQKCFYPQPADCSP